MPWAWMYLAIGRRADEGHRLHVRMFEQRVHRLLVALHHVEGSGRQSGVVQEFGGEQRGRGVALRGLEDEGIAAGQRHRRHPHRHHEGKVEGCDAGGDAERHALVPVVDAATDAVRMLALEQLRDAAGELDHLQAALHLAQRIRQGLAVLGGEQAGDVGLVLLDQLAELEHHAGAALRCRHAPVARRAARCGHGAIDVGARGQCHLARDAALCRVEHLAAAAIAAAVGLAVDPVADEVGGIYELISHVDFRVSREEAHCSLPRRFSQGPPASIRWRLHSGQVFLHGWQACGRMRASLRGVVVQLVRIPACHAGGRGFESRPLRQASSKKAPSGALFCCREFGLRHAGYHSRSFRFGPSLGYSAR
jgi:hypothetical protein